MTSMGIVSTGTYFPDTYVTAKDIAEQSGLPEWVVREKLGIERKFVADPNVHPNEMAVIAARKAIEKAGIDPLEIDVVLGTTEEWREYLLWTTAIDLAYEIGAKNAWGIDLHTRCATTIAAMKFARSLMADDPSINTILIGGGYATSHFIDLSDVNTSFLFNIGAGAGAMIVKRDWPVNRVLGMHLIADGSMSRHVIVPASGTMVLIAGLSSITGPITVAYWMQIFGLNSYFLVLAAALLLMAVTSIWRVLTVPAMPMEYKVQSTLQVASNPVGTVLHVEEDVLSEQVD